MGTDESFGGRIERRWVAAAFAVVVGALTVAVSSELFPYHSLNHDEAVYLNQAAMLLDGRLTIRPPVAEAFRPWFFVERPDGRLYPKYAPVPAAMFALGKLAGSYRLALGGIAAGNVALTYLLATELFDSRRGLLAAILLAGSPLFVLQSTVFLPYAPTTLWNLAFAVAYVRADRTNSRLAAAVAGCAVGIAFFARPFTAVVFAAPFVGHAVWRMWAGDGESWFDRAAVERASLTAAVGLCGVVVTLAYNAVVTGAPLRFPYQAFAPADGIGFGTRRILGYSREYTPALAVRANAAVVTRLFGRWVAGGPVGTLLAVVGLVALARRARLARRVVFAVVRRPDDETKQPAGVVARRTTLAATLVTVVVGNVFFWGNLNILGSLDGANGLIDALGPYYHFDLLVPTAVFAADGAIRLADRATRLADRATRLADGITRAVGSAGAFDDRRRLARGLVLAVVVVGTLGGSVGYAAGPIDQNADVTRTYQSAYAVDVPAEPVVFLPMPLGEWLGHPYQAYRNDPSFETGPVFALRTRQFAVIEAFPDRPVYRYTVRGEWDPLDNRAVTPHLQPVAVRNGERLRLDARIAVPSSTETVSARLSGDTGEAAFGGAGSLAGEQLRLDLTFDATGDDTARVRLSGPLTAVDDRSITVSGRETVTVRLFADYGTGAGLTYRLVVPVRVANGTVTAATPVIEVCERPRRCGGEAAYVPGETPGNVTTSLTAVNETAG